MDDFLHTVSPDVSSDHCQACHRALPPFSARTRHFTCDDVCHRVWIERLIAQYGETRRIVDCSTGKTHLVPTRVILEQGIKGTDLPNYPETR